MQNAEARTEDKFSAAQHLEKERINPAANGITQDGKFIFFNKVRPRLCRRLVTVKARGMDPNSLLVPPASRVYCTGLLKSVLNLRVQQISATVALLKPLNRG